MFIIALAFGVGQVLLTNQLIKAFNQKSGKKIFLFFIIKFLLYAVGIGLLVLKHIWQFGVAVAGFAASVPLTAIALYVYKTFCKK